MDIRHPQLEKRNFFRVHNSGYGIWSFIYSILAAIYSNSLHRNIMHHHTSYQKFIKSSNINTSRFESGSIKDVKLFLKANEKLNLNVTINEGRLCPNSGKLQVWKSVKIGNGEKK